MIPFSRWLKPALEGKTLTRQEAFDALEAIVAGAGTPAQLGAFLTALKMRGETYEELVGFARVMRKLLIPVKIARKSLLDTCGTGGDGACTFNISTTAAFIAAGAGATVAKHGNRAVSSRCGSADVLEALGIKTQLKPAAVARCIEKAGVGFLFAPAHHPALIPLQPVRKELGVRTVFNVLGPMSNPALPRRQLMGVYAVDLTRPVAKALGELGSERAIVVCSRDGLDELSLAAPTVMADYFGGRVRVSELKPWELGFKRAALKAISGGDARRNARLLTDVLDGRRGARRDVCLLNAGAALMAGGLARGMKEGIELAALSIDSGNARRALTALKKASHE